MTSQTRETADAVSITVREDAPGQCVSILGRIDIHSVPDLRLALHRVIDGSPGPLALDLADSVIGDATGLWMLVEAHRRCLRQGRPMSFENACDRAARLLRAVRLHPARRLARTS